MSGESNLATLLRTMRPQPHNLPFVFCSVEPAAFEHIHLLPMGFFREEEGITLILAQHEADQLGLGYEATWACITLTVHSALNAVGFLAAVASRLASAGISVNPVSGYYHDHLFVPWDVRVTAMRLLEAISAEPAG